MTKLLKLKRSEKTEEENCIKKEEAEKEVIEGNESTVRKEENSLVTESEVKDQEGKYLERKSSSKESSTEATDLTLKRKVFD